MFLERQYESYVESIRDTFDNASQDCDETVSDLDSLAWEHDDLLTAIEDGEDYDIDAADRLVERFSNRIDRGASDAESRGSEIDYYEVTAEIKDAVIEELRNSNYHAFADLL